MITRGIWLIIVEIVINNFLWWFDITFGFTNLQVIWAIGICMIALGVIIYFPKRLILGLGLLIVLGHNLLDNITLQGKNMISILWYFLHQMNGIEIGGGRLVWFSYPVLPWIGVMLLGYCFGEFYKKDADSALRRKSLLYIGLSAVILFLVLRTWNIYGDLNHWLPYETVEKSIISYLNVSKYPPSLSFILITLGPALLFLRAIDNMKTKFSNKLLVFGRVPFFYYILHIFVIHVVAIIGLVITGKDWRLMILDASTMSNGLLEGYGYSLFTVYLVWLSIVTMLYPICRVYMRYKVKTIIYLIIPD